MKLFLFGLVLGVALLSGCLDGGSGAKDSRLFKGVPSAEITNACLAVKDDVCALFKCMVDQCWCAPEGAVLQKGKKQLQTDQCALSVVEEYVQASGSEYNVVRKAARLNPVFWNVFAENAAGDEKVFTVAADGTIIKTQCGV